MIRMDQSGSFKRTLGWLTRLGDGDIYRDLDRYGRAGVAALAAATPQDSGRTASSWSYRVSGGRGKYQVEWYNTNVNQGALIAVLIQYGHGTGTGGYVAGIDYINPAITPIMNQISEDVWRKVVDA